MKRSSFLKTSILTTSITSLLPLFGESKVKEIIFKKGDQEFYELRTYILKNDAQQKIVEEYFEKAAIPAFNRLGIKNIGVFRELKPQGQTKIVVLIPFGSYEAYMKAEEKLNADANYMAAGAAYLNAPASEPAYDRIESSLLFSFEHMPKILLPEKKQRIFELRRYESASEMASKKKIEMFNQAGEIDIFKKVGLTPVFFGESLIGPLRPNITYMITFDDMEEHDKNWKAFGSDPKWKQISQMPEYADAKLVSRITSTFLVPTDFSQI
jgi:hypothetical protein